MDEKRYEKKIELQSKMISRQSEQIKDLESQVRKLKLEVEEKNNIINSIAPLRDELAKNVAEVKKHKKESKALIEELKKMKDIVNQTVYKGRWRIIKLLMK